MNTYEETWVGDPERDAKVGRNRALRDKRIRLSSEHFEGKHDLPVEDCVECELWMEP
jgi:formate hydrogenlyase subunit 6/NADH:ubiquinone oxidoreductase subunit I